LINSKCLANLKSNLFEGFFSLITHISNNFNREQRSSAVRHMKRIIFFTAVAFCTGVAQGHTEELENTLPESGLFELEKELLSLEDELLNLEHSLPLAPSKAVEISPAFSENIDLVIEETPAEKEDSFLATEESRLIEEPLFSIEESSLAPLPKSDIPALVSTATLESNIAPTGIEVSFKQVFNGSPLIYSILFAMSLLSISICLYSVLRLRQQTSLFGKVSKEVRIKLMNNDSKDALEFCQKNPSLLSRIISSGISSRKHGLNAMLDSMKSEGKRATISAWQQLGILQDIAIIAPMLGLLGTVVGLFYAFYDLNRSFDSITNLLDGLGISVGTTVAGIAVAILAMLLQSAAKFRLVRVLARVETEASSLAHLIDEKNSQ
jgi:biopolymer transport protein ExbB